MTLKLSYKLRHIKSQLLFNFNFYFLQMDKICQIKS